MHLGKENVDTLGSLDFKSAQAFLENPHERVVNIEERERDRVMHGMCRREREGKCARGRERESREKRKREGMHERQGTHVRGARERKKKREGMHERRGGARERKEREKERGDV